MKMIRKQFYINAEQDAKLKRLAQEQGLTEAELVRTAIERLNEVSYAQDRAASSGVVREVALMERYVASGEDQSQARAADSLLDYGRDAQAWEEELKFMRSLASKKDAGEEGGAAWQFNREELYEERLNKILRRH